MATWSCEGREAESLNDHHDRFEAIRDALAEDDENIHLYELIESHANISKTATDIGGGDVTEACDDACTFLEKAMLQIFLDAMVKAGYEIRWTKEKEVKNGKKQ